MLGVLKVVACSLFTLYYFTDSLRDGLPWIDVILRTGCTGVAWVLCFAFDDADEPEDA